MTGGPMSANEATASDIGVPSILGTVGLALFCSWDFLGFFSQVLSSPSVYTLEFEHLLRLVSLCAFTVTLFSVRRFTNTFSTATHRTRLLVTAAVLGSLPAVLTVCNSQGLTVPAPLAVVSWTGFGAASAPLILLWGTFSCTLHRRRAILLTAVSYAAGALWYILISYLEPTVGVIATEITLLLSVGLLTGRSGILTPVETMDIRVSREHLDLWVKTAFRVVFEGTAFGLMLYLVVSGTDALKPTLVIGSAYVIAGALIAVPVQLRVHRLVLWGTIQRISFPLLVAGLLVIPFADAGVRMLCAFVLLLVFACYDISMWGLLAILGNEHKVQRIYHYSRGRSTITLGLSIGWGLGYFLTYSPVGDATTMLIVSLGLALALVVMDAIVPYGSDHLAVLEVPERYVHSTPGSWRERCAKVAEEHALSPREFDVFVLLAKGRNVAHIERSLGISGHTVKTHVYRIYKKLGVNAQQELIDLVENASSEKFI